MSKTTSNSVNIKAKRDTPKISTRTESTTKRTVATKPSSTSTSTLTKRTTATKLADDKDKTRGAQTTKPPTATRTNDKPKPTTVKSTSSSTHTTPRAINPTKKSINPKQNVTSQRTTSKAPASSILSQKQPLRAKHTSEIKEAVQKNYIAKTTTSTTALKHATVNTKPNAVLDTPHNVTVSSPPSKRKSEKREEQKDEQRDRSAEKPTEYKMTRKGSRILAPDEIVVLKRESAKKRLEEQIHRDSLGHVEQQNSGVVHQTPVAFEVNFNANEKKAKITERPKSEVRERSRSRAKETNKTTNVEDEQNYSDDFDSYESDFETESSHESSRHNTEESEEDSQKTTDEEDSVNDNDDDSNEEYNNDDKMKESDEYPSEDESEITQDPITVLQRDKERKLDSGHYEMNSRRNPKLSEVSSSQSTQHLVDSMDNFSLNTSDQLDSGISTYGPITLNTLNRVHSGNFQVFYGGYKDFTFRPIFNKRGSDLMSKIQFDTLEFTLLDLKPISYDVYMQTFGRLNTGQTATQTQDDLMHVEQQTEPYETRSMWTQHPAQYDLEMVQQLYKKGLFKETLSQNCCGEVTDIGNQRTVAECELEHSLQAIKKLENQRCKRNLHNHVQTQRKPVNYESLNAFLLRSSLIINQILGSSESKRQALSPAQQLGNLSSFTDSSYQLEANFLNTLKVVKIFSSPSHNLFVTVHESLPATDVYKSDFSQLLMVWCISSPDKPIRLLTTWSNVARLEISHDSEDVIVAALRDGSVALWDLMETYSFCSKLDGYLTHFAATQSIVPFWGGSREKSEILMDLGSCLDVRGFRRNANKLNTTSSLSSKKQFVSLHDSGILTVWSLVESVEFATINLLNNSQKSDKLKYSPKLQQQKFDYSSPWARVKLIQSSIVQLKDYLQTKPLTSLSRFDKTKSLFQKNIYSDEALKELHNTDENFGQQGLRFSSIECGSETIYICTNRNFIMMCSKTLKPERFRRIALNESRLLFPTALKVLSNENFLAVGLSNGAVTILNCALNKQLKTRDSAEKCKTPGTPFPGQTLKSPFDDIDPISGKSCAIQNIVLNSQKSYNSMDFNSTSQQEFRPNTAAFIALIDSQQKPFELRVYDQQVILSGSVLRTNLIQSLELSADGWRLFALTNNRIRVYDFYMDKEICSEEEMQDPGYVLDIGCSKTNQNELNLLTLEKDSNVTVYILKK